jgi:hypothetical protein
MRHARLLGFVSPDGKDFTLVGMSRIENDVELEISLKGLEIPAEPVGYFRTTRTEDCELMGEIEAEDETLRVVVPEGSIFTLTTLR